jgi:hypothetical protein
MKRKSLADAPYDVPSDWRWRRRGLINLSIVLVVLAVLVELFGLPHVAGEYRCHGCPVSLERAYIATYYGPLGRFDLGANECGPGITFVKWVKLVPSPSSRGLQLAQRLVAATGLWDLEPQEPMWEETR